MKTLIPQNSAIGVITPASSLQNPEQIRNGLTYLTNLGYKIVLGNFVYNSNNHFSGTLQERASDIMNFFKNDAIKAIIATRGGYGSQAVLPYLDYDIIRCNPKPIIGFSDITALQNAIYTQTEVPSIAGIMLKYDFADSSIHNQTFDSFSNLINGHFADVSAGNILNSGFAEGVLIGGNLRTFVSLAGTTYFPPLSGKILLVEDVDEKTYNIERMLTQLEQQKDFEQLSAIVFGAFTNCELNHPEDNDVEKILDNFAAKHSRIPMIKHFPHGHIKARQCLPIGVKIKLLADGKIPLLQAAD